MFFQKNLKFSVYIKDNSGKNILTDKGLDTSAQTRTHYFYPICYENNAGYSIPQKVQGSKLVIDNDQEGDTEEKNIYYKFDFNFSADQFQRRGIEIFGFYHQVQQKNKKREIPNTNGRISLKVSENGFISKFNKYYANEFDGKYNLILNSNDTSSGDTSSGDTSSGDTSSEEKENTEWIKYATEIHVNRSNVQSGGTITLDKYAFMGQFERPPQPVGEVRLKAVGGNKKVYVNSFIKNSYDKSDDESCGESCDVYFTGLGIGLSYKDDSNSDSMSLNLSGIEKKLQDIKLAGSPYFDGDPIKTVMDYLSEYANFVYEFNNDFNCYSYDNDVLKTWTNNIEKVDYWIGRGRSWMMNGEAPCPRSVEFQRPAINFILGTTVFDAINQVCQKTNKTWFITKEGIIRIIDQNIYGIPINVAYSLSQQKPSFVLNSNQILDINLQPYFDNVYNQVITASLKGKRLGGDYTDVTKISNSLKNDNMVPNIRYTKLSYINDLKSDELTGKEKITNVNFPWSRFILNSELAILSEEEMDKVHDINCNQFGFATFTGGITIPGNSMLEIFDTIAINDSDNNNEDSFGIGVEKKSPELFFITNISHNYSSSSRVWTTTLQVTHIDSSFVEKTLSHFNDLTIWEDDPSEPN